MLVRLSSWSAARQVEVGEHPVADGRLEVYGTTKEYEFDVGVFLLLEIYLLDLTEAPEDGDGVVYKLGRDLAS